MDHLEEAKRYISLALDEDAPEWTQPYAQLATAHALIAICERLPPPAEKWSEAHARLRQEEQDEL